ncbi:hypothetical protein LCGC14_2819180 [marine sediment metagenome]|uniref:Uncharacterized protein n=1 Tax=marine sediment metagenome TaxID=412755 RepID=A0A0F8YHJ3_9ZZZZ
MNQTTMYLLPALLTLVSSCALLSPEISPKMDATATVGNVGGGGDSVALWLAIGALGAIPLSYPAQRWLRLRKNGKN